VKKFFVGLALVFIGLLSTFAPASAADGPKVILDQLLTGDAPDLSAQDLNIPDDLAPGFHELTVEVYDDNGVISTKTALFCKDLNGELHFDNVCPGLTAKPIAKKAEPYYPFAKPEETISFFAAVVAFASSLFSLRNSSQNDFDQKDSDTPSDFGGVAAAGLGARESVRAWGDRRKYTKWRMIGSLDSLPHGIIKWTSKVSYLFARIVADARYLRTIFGNIAWLTIPAALVLSYLGLVGIGNKAVPFSSEVTMYLMILGVFDAFAGLLGAGLYINFLFANGSLNSQQSIFLASGFALLFFAPGLLASKFRPLHRTVKDFKSFWERATDYVLGILLTAWATTKLVEVLPGLSGLDLPIAKDANRFGLVVAAALFVRLLIEEFAWYFYPERLSQLTVEIREPGKFQLLRGIIFKTGVFVILAQPFIGWNWYLYTGLILFVIPQIIGIFDEYLPKAKFVRQILPGGAVKIVFFGILGTFLNQQLINVGYPNRQLVLVAFVALMIPAVAYSVLDNFASTSYFSFKKSHKFRYLYRLGALIIFGLLLTQVLGHDPVVEIQKVIENPAASYKSISDWVTTTWNTYTT
jgi:hypothetical protein